VLSEAALVLDAFARVAVHPSGMFAYVTGAPEGGITVIDAQRNRVLTSFLLSEEATLNAASVAMTADGATAVVPEYVFANVYLIDTASHAVRSFHPLASSSAAPEGIAVATLPGGCPPPPPPRLTADLTATDTEMRVDRLDALPLVGTVRIDDELRTYRSTFMSVVRELARGIRGTSPAAHATGTLVFVIRPGDANCDTMRGAADLIAVVTDVVAGSEPGPCGNDANGDRVVDGNDFGDGVRPLLGVTGTSCRPIPLEVVSRSEKAMISSSRSRLT
jgi:hypothetical protein